MCIVFVGNKGNEFSDLSQNSRVVVLILTIITSWAYGGTRARRRNKTRKTRAHAVERKAV